MNITIEALKCMMKDIDAGNVNCVIVKDLSGLGRDYILLEGRQYK